MPNPPKPQVLKMLAGTWRADREPALKAVAEIAPLGAVLDAPPEPPDWLPTAEAVNEWNRLARFLVEKRSLTEGGLDPLGILCSLHGKLAQMWAAGECPTGYMLAQYRALINDFRLTPASQARGGTVRRRRS
jgi:phage terminase small subunit